MSHAFYAWSNIEGRNALEHALDFLNLDLLSRSLLFDICFRKFGPRDNRTQLLLKRGVNFKEVPEAFAKLLEDTFRKFGPLQATQLLLQNGVKFTQIPCGLPKLLEDTFCELGDGPDTQLLLQNGAKFA